MSTKPTHPLSRQMLLVAVLAAMPALSHAGRPLTVDDANVNDPGNGHVEAWYARDAGKSHVYTIAPAYSPSAGIEIGGLVSRDRTLAESTSALQLKWRITPSQSEGCNIGASAGITQTTGLRNGGFVNGLLSCNGLMGNSLHFNLGRADRPGERSTGWGVAVEREIGSLTAHIETFGATGMKPTTQIGMRTDLAKGVQIDGTLGRTYGETIFSIGLKFQF